MDCRTAAQQIEHFREGVLDNDIREQVLAHLGECETCRRTLATLDVLDKRLAAAMARPIPPNFASRIAAAIEQEEIGRRNPSAMFWIQQAALLAACLMVILVFWPGEPNPPEPVVPATVVQTQARERPFFEPGPEDHGVGKPFVIAARGKTAYAGKTHIVVSQREGRTPQLTVDAFPK